MNEVYIGKVTGTGAAITINLGWQPDYVRIVNLTDADRTDEWFRDGSAAGTSVTTGAAVAAQASNGITAFAGTQSAAAGFTIGTAISEADKVLGILAIRNK